ncbi:MAG TPA: DNA repair ATPase [Pirellulaceae bacterium]|nr:DNA repair ATPase [Pirellulaceae bacterium]HMO91242.1 DNA repair ATPase [Pirellulaceae bacterium]HMP68574.1 DNA repair ATPase [Pirellulaceae bacterium]
MSDVKSHDDSQRSSLDKSSRDRAETDLTSDVDRSQLDRSTYQLLRDRLANQAAELQQRMDQLNQLRREVFGSIPTRLLSTERITTEHNCVAQDIVAIGKQFLFGYNVFMGLRAEVRLADVFAAYEERAGHFSELGLDLLGDARFNHDFQQLYKYYRNTRFSKFQLAPPFLYLVFQVGGAFRDLKAFKFQIDADKLTYIDNRSDHEVKFPPQHDFVWIRAHRDQHRSGRFPHISIEDRVFVETIGGDLTIKVEDNTEDGQGIYREPVDDPDQTLDDAETFYAVFGNLILLKIRPYREQEYRYLVYAEKTRTVSRLDDIAEACVSLPEDHGLIFSSGYILQSGELKRFDNNLSNLVFEKRVAAHNAEDFLYVFFHPETCHYVLLSYNMIEQSVLTPLVCDGFSMFEDGRRILFRSDPSPQKHHALQIWQTPFVGSNVPQTQKTDAYIYKIGNREVVRALAECTELIQLTTRDDSYANLYVDIAKLASDIADGYFWLAEPQAFDLKSAVEAIRQSATAAINEFDKVVRIRANTKQQLQAVAEAAQAAIDASRRELLSDIDHFVEHLAALRALRGRAISLKELRFVDLVAVEELETAIADRTADLSHDCLKFLLREDSLQRFIDRVDHQYASIEQMKTVAECRNLDEQIREVASDLEMLIDVVNNLHIDDATQRTEIIDNISSLFANVNRTRATLRNRSQSLLSVEGAAEFNSQLKLLAQAVVNYLDHCDSPQRCDEYLTRILVEIEELEGRFVEFDEFLVQLAEKREEVYSAFDTRKLQLIEARNRRATALTESADRILKGVASRVNALKSIDEIHGYFASDLMVEKVRDIVEQLLELEETVKADELQSRQKTIREEAIRQLKDRQELYVDGQNIIQFGDHRFTVNTQPLDLTIVMRDRAPFFHLSGTNFLEPIRDEEFLRTSAVWDQVIVSENREVYRGEYLAYKMLQAMRAAQFHLDAQQWLALTPQEQILEVQQFMAPRYTEGYVKGVHDSDARLILNTMLELERELGLLRFSPQARVLGILFWNQLEKSAKKSLEIKLQSLGRARGIFGDQVDQRQICRELEEQLKLFCDQASRFARGLCAEAASALVEQLSLLQRFVISRRAQDLKQAFTNYLRQHETKAAFASDMKSSALNALDRFDLAISWLQGFSAQARDDSAADESHCVDEVAALIIDQTASDPQVFDAQEQMTLHGLLGEHPRLTSTGYELNCHQVMQRLHKFETVTVPDFVRYMELKQQLVEHRREELKLDDFKPKVLTSFVRNQLINQVYLPLIGANLAKQLGVAGEEKRTDLMGLLLLVSPPGYGKTTLMEYVANRLGITFVKINGPSVGHHVTSLDPAEAPHASARQEIEKLNLALEMGDNVMIYLDDIQHCHPELLQKFISLCDATRRIEGVFQGRPKTYDLRGRKVCVVMAGNPYTERGEKFQIPDMLANRADTYNLGDVIGNNLRWFELSYLENSLTSNPALSTLQARSSRDTYALIEMATNRSAAQGSLEGEYSLEQINEIVNVLQKLLRVREVILRVNREYIDSAAQADAYRTEPPFRMQGSYRDMNKIAERVVPMMNDAELMTLITSHYENQAQTLTTDAESNLLKFREMTEQLSDEQRERLAEIRRRFQRNLVLGTSSGDDRVSQIISQINLVSEGLHEISRTVQRGTKMLSQPTEEVPSTIDTAMLGELSRGVAELAKFNQGLQALRDLYEHQAQAIAALPQQVAQQKIEITNKIPNSILNVLRNQFRVLQTWMEPILSLAEKTSDAQGLAEAAKLTQKNYDRLINRLENDDPPES